MFVLSFCSTRHKVNNRHTVLVDQTVLTTVSSLWHTYSKRNFNWKWWHLIGNENQNSVIIGIQCYIGVNKYLIHLNQYILFWQPGQRTQYNKSLWAGRSGDWIPVGGWDFVCPFRLALMPTQPPVQWSWVFPRGKAAREWCWPASSAMAVNGLELYLSLPSQPA